MNQCSVCFHTDIAASSNWNALMSSQVLVLHQKKSHATPPIPHFCDSATRLTNFNLWVCDRKRAGCVRGCHTCAPASFCRCVEFSKRANPNIQTPPGRKNRNGSCHRGDCATSLWIHARLKKMWNCSLFCNPILGGQASPCRQINDDSDNRLGSTAAVQFLLLYFNFQTKVLFRKEACDIDLLRFSDFFDTDKFFPVYICPGPHEILKCCMNVSETTVPLRSCFVLLLLQCFQHFQTTLIV